MARNSRPVFYRPWNAVPRLSSRLWLFAASSIATVMSLPIAEGQAQDIQVTTPRVGINDSYNEATGVRWGFRFGGPSSQVFGSFNQGSAGGAIPPFGGYDPNTDATFGFGSFDNDGNGFSLGLRMGKGSTRTMTGASPSVVVPNGGVGSIFDGSLRPFVTGLIPVVGNPGDIVEPYTPPMQPPSSSVKEWSNVFASGERPPPAESATASSGNFRNQDSSAQRGDLSVAALQAQRTALVGERAEQLKALVAEAESYEKEGNYSRARSNIRKAIKLADERQRYELQLKLEALLEK